MGCRSRRIVIGNGLCGTSRLGAVFGTLLGRLFGGGCIFGGGTFWRFVILIIGAIFVVFAQGCFMGDCFMGDCFLGDFVRVEE